MNIAGLVGALLPVFFVLALGYVAGKRNSFDADQAAGLSKLAVAFALPATLFVSMTDIRRDLLLQQGRLVLVLILADGLHKQVEGSVAAGARVLCGGRPREGKGAFYLPTVLSGVTQGMPFDQLGLAAGCYGAAEPTPTKH
jgi:Membrane transport protein/Aldehyde dehydrogenase family